MIKTVSGQDDLVLENVMISDSVTYEAANSITAGPSFVITESGKVTFKTGNQIYLRSGFTILSGGTFQTLFNETYGPVQPETEETPRIFRLSQNYPNPFNPATTIQYTIPKRSEVEISVYSTSGQKLETLVQKTLAPGTYKEGWDGSGYASGVYIYQIKTENFILSKKMLLIR